jgi:hypothetical protein
VKVKKHEKGRKTCIAGRTSSQIHTAGKEKERRKTLEAIMMDDTTCNCQWCMLFGKKEEALPSCDTTFLVPISYMDDDALNKLVDWETVLSWGWIHLF